MRKLLCVLAVVAWYVAPVAQAGDPDLKMDIQAASHAYMSAYNSGDLETLLALHTKDAIVMAPNQPAARGHEAIRASLVQVAEAEGGGHLDLKTVEVGGMGDTAWEIGHYEVSLDGGDTLVDKGHTTVIWKKVDGSWRMYSDIWNSDLPLEANAAPVAGHP